MNLNNLLLLYILFYTWACAYFSKILLAYTVYLIPIINIALMYHIIIITAHNNIIWVEAAVVEKSTSHLEQALRSSTSLKRVVGRLLNYRKKTKREWWWESEWERYGQKRHANYTSQKYTIIIIARTSYFLCAVCRGGELIAADFVFSFLWLPSPGSGRQKESNGTGIRVYLPCHAYSCCFSRR